MGSSKRPAVMGVDEQVFTETVPRLKEFDFFAGANNSELLLYAFALGAAHGMEIPIAHMHSGGFARTESFSEKFVSVIIALPVAKDGTGDPDVVCDQASAFSEAERYANGGFQMIAGDLKRNLTAETYANHLLAELDKKYELIKGEAIP